MRDDNSQQQFEHHQAEEWHEYNRRLLNQFDMIFPIIQGKEKYPDMYKGNENGI